MDETQIALLRRSGERVLMGRHLATEGFGPDRYVYVEANAGALYPISRGLRDRRTAIADGSVQLYGDPELVRALPAWFEEAPTTPEPAAEYAKAK